MSRRRSSPDWNGGVYHSVDDFIDSLTGNKRRVRRQQLGKAFYTLFGFAICSLIFGALTWLFVWLLDASQVVDHQLTPLAGLGCGGVVTTAWIFVRSLEIATASQQ